MVSVWGVFVRCLCGEVMLRFVYVYCNQLGLGRAFVWGDCCCFVWLGM